MAAPRPPGENELRQRFNQLVGTRTGRPSRTGKAASKKGISERRKKADQGAGRQAISTLVKHGGGKVPSTVRTQQRAWLGTGSTNPVAATNKTFNDIYDNLTSDLNKQSKDQIAVRTAYADQMLDKGVDPSTGMLLEDQEAEAGKSKVRQEALASGASPELAEEMVGWSTQPSIDEQYLGGNLQKYVVEPLTRPLAAIAGGAYAAMEGEYAAEDKGKGNWDQILEAMSRVPGGVQRGLTNKEKHGFGDLYELAKTEGDDILSRGVRNLEEAHPMIEQQLARAFGITGDISADPIGKFIGGSKAGIINGERATSASMRRYTRELAEKWAADVETNVITSAAKAPGNYRVFPTEAAIADHIEKELNNLIDTAELEIRSGGSRGRYEVLNSKMTAGLAGAKGSQALQDSLTSLFTDRVQRMVDGMQGRGTKLTGNTLDNWAALNPDFTEFLDDLTDNLVQKGKLSTNATRNSLASYLSKGDETVVRQLEQELIDAKYTPYLQEAADSIAREFRNSYYNAPALRVGNKVMPSKAVGRAYSSLQTKFFDDVGKNFRYNSVFPGSLSLETTRARAWGVKATEEFEDEIREMAQPFSKADSIEIQDAIEDNKVHLLSPEKQAAANWIKDQYRWMYDDEFIYGARGRSPRSQPGIDSSSTPYDPNYAFVSNKGGTVGNRGRFKDARKRQIHENVRAKNNQGAGRFKTRNAKEEGLRPSENAFEALRQRRIKYNRDMIRARFLADMVDKYGIYSKLSPSGQGYAAARRNLEKIDFRKLPEHIRTNIQQTGEAVYLPREMAEMVNIFDDITKWHSGEQGKIARSFATVMRHIKKAMTLPWPGFHNKNMIGDVFMGLLDDINPDDYANVVRKGTAALRGGEGGTFKILKADPGLDMSFRDMWNKYQSEANSGFINSELGNLEAPVRSNLPTRVISKTGQIAQDVSGFREDIGRFTHYTTAYKQEAEALWKSGERNLSNIERKASSAALWRVNNYKFDYNALMLWEKRTKTLAFPFYTFIRKAAPTLVQALYQDPRWINVWTKFLYQRSVEGQETADSFDGFRVPKDIRDVGYAFVGGQEDKPWYVTNDILPTSVFNSVKTSGGHEFFNSLLSQTALPYQIAIEQGTGRQTFLDKPLQDQSFADYMFSKIPGTREFGQLFDSEKPWGERLLSSRIGAGLPIRHLTESQQLYAEQEWQDRLIDDPLQKINYGQDLFYISRQYPSDGPEIFTVKNNAVLDPQGNGQVVAQFYTPEEAIQYVKQNLPDDYKKVPTTLDIDDQGLPVRRPIRD